MHSLKWNSLCLLSQFFFVASIAQGGLAADTSYCWQDLSEGLLKQNVSSLSGEPSLAASSNGSLWLTWAEDDVVQVRQMRDGEWKAVQSPDGPLISSHRAWIAVGTEEKPYLLWAGSDESQTNLYVARWNGIGWERVGTSLSAYPDRYTHAGDATMILDGRGLPIVAWQEANGNGPRSLHVARWSGAKWVMLGEKPVSEGLDIYSLEPHLSIDRTGTIWLTWVAGTRQRSYLQVARWQGGKWEDVTDADLERLTSGQDVRMPHLAVVDESAVIATWFYRIEKKTSFLAAARWDGKKWLSVPPPAFSLGGTRSAWSPSMAVGKDGTVLLAWMEKDSSGFSNAYVQRLKNDTWEPVFSQIQLDPGYSDVENPVIVSGTEGEFYLAWDEPSERHQHVRVIQAKRCAPGESPSPFPAVVPIETFWPKSVDEAVEKIVGRLTPESRATLLQTSRKELGKFNLSWGMGIRNGYGLWRGNRALLGSCGDPEMEPDQCSMIIMMRVWDILHQGSRSETSPDAGNER